LGIEFEEDLLFCEMAFG